MAKLNPKNSSLIDGKEPYTEDGWTFEEVKKFENILNQFDEPPPPEFFQQVAHVMPWKTIESIKFHYELLMRDLSIIINSYDELISGYDEGIFDEDEGQVICNQHFVDSQSEKKAENDKGKRASNE